MKELREMIENGIDDQDKLENVLLGIVDALENLQKPEVTEEVEKPTKGLGLFGKKGGG